MKNVVSRKRTAVLRNRSQGKNAAGNGLRVAASARTPQNRSDARRPSKGKTKPRRKRWSCPTSAPPEPSLFFVDA